ncbi:MAG: MFS transporter [Haliea sp.]|uniref:MFS transporter n=1 Tax=Haliea sp. TaxID=1932666 RepID=UPI000C568CCE|nr:MFS transporter [Haliea sp.]MBM70394.1 MFS transporter [Haliea sp.]|tara:strand:+ start:6629 stop:7933 length:1305 start_codon:yes stop_codon:yes gene_type:complete
MRRSSETAAAGTPPVSDPARRPAVVMASIAFLAHNAAVGLCYGSFGVLVMEFERHFAAGRAQTSLAFSLVVLASGLMAPFVGALLGRTHIRSVMISGALLTSVGFFCLPLTQQPSAMLACFALLIGPGISLLGLLPAVTLVNNWFSHRQGLVLGLVMMPVAVTVVPLIVVKLLPVLGFEILLRGIGLVYLTVIPVLLMVKDSPEHWQASKGHKGSAEAADALATAKPQRPSVSAVVWHPAFMPLVIATGLMMGAGVAKNTHMVPLLVEGQWSMEQATLLLAVSGGCAVLGSLLLGWLADRHNAAAVIACNALLQSVVWLILITPASFTLLLLDAVLIGMCIGGLSTAKAVVVSRVFGRSQFAFVSGLMGFCTLPLLFTLSPLMGLLRQTSGDYTLPISLIIGGFFIAAGCMWLVSRLERQTPRPLNAAPSSATL